MRITPKDIRQMGKWWDSMAPWERSDLISDLDIDPFINDKSWKELTATQRKLLTRTYHTFEGRIGRNELQEAVRAALEEGLPGRRDLRNTNLKAVLKSAQSNAELVARFIQKGESPPWDAMIGVINYIDNALKLVR